MLLRLFALPFYWFLERYVRLDKNHTFVAVIHGSAMTRNELDEIYSFRNNCYRAGHGYLVPDSSTAKISEKSFDLNSFHARVFDKQGNLVGVTRMLPYPFEMSALELPENLRLSQFKNYLEVSRLVCSKRGSGIGRRLILSAGLWSIRETTFDGFLAVCRKGNLGLFNKFGLSVVANFELMNRPGSQYCLIKADFRLITKCTLGYFSRKFNPVRQISYQLRLRFNKLN
jgi:hypothetical protein